MIILSIVLLQIVSVIALITNDHQINPYFVCHKTVKTTTTTSSSSQTATAIMDTLYTVTVNQHDQIVVENCTAPLIDAIVSRLCRTNLRTRSIRLRTTTSRLSDLGIKNVDYLDLSRNELTSIDLRRFRRLKTLNLTANRLSTLRSIKLAENVLLDSLDVTRNRLFKFEPAHLPPARKLYSHSNNILELESNVTLPSYLRLLDLTRNEIENVTAVAFYSTNLTTLNLSINLITAVSKSTFEHLPSLETLILECNKIFDIEEGAFSANAKLIELNLRDNNLSILKKDVFDQLNNLQVLDVSRNDLLELPPDTVQHLNNLVDLSVSENAKLCDAECEYDRLEFLLVLSGRLRTLKMDRLKLRQFPITLTTSVRSLDLSRNRLRIVQQGNLENFPFLETLTLSNNNIETTENDVFSRMEFLLTLHLDNNKLQRVPNSLPPSLRTLHLHHNRILKIERNDFNAGFSNLETLTLDSNSIATVESGAFRFLRRLRTLDLSDNPILALSTDAFDGPTKLKTLRISHLAQVVINVTDLRYFPISEMRNVRHLNLSHSPVLVRSFLADLPLLATVKQLESLDLGYANLTRLPSHLQDFLSRLRYLNVAGNELDCSGHLWWHDWRQSCKLDVRQVTHDENDECNLKVHLSMEPLPSTNERVIRGSSCSSNNNISINAQTGSAFWSFVLDSPSTSRRTYEQTTERMPDISTKRYRRSKKNELTKIVNPIATSSSISSQQNVSFFDWFPAVTLAATTNFHEESAAVLDDREIENGTHPGVVIFSAIVCFLLALLLSMMIPSFVQKYRWSRHRYKMSQLDNDECRRSIEISSVSAFVETEMTLE